MSLESNGSASQFKIRYRKKNNAMSKLYDWLYFVLTSFHQWYLLLFHHFLLIHLNTQLSIQYLYQTRNRISFFLFPTLITFIKTSKYSHILLLILVLFFKQPWQIHCIILQQKLWFCLFSTQNLIKKSYFSLLLIKYDMRLWLWLKHVSKMV